MNAPISAPPRFDVVRARLARVPSRARAALVTFGAIVGLPGLFAVLGAVAAGLEVTSLAVALFLLSGLAFFGGTVAAWVLIFQARSRLKRAQTALFAGDLDTATREARFVVSTVFRADYQLGALYTLALAAEHLGAFAEAGPLFLRALDAIPTFAAVVPGRRVRALATGHAALSFAACGDLPRAERALAQCYGHLGDPTRPGAFDALFKIDDSSFGAIGVNTQLVEIENRRDPRPVAVLAAALVAFRAGRAAETARLLDAEAVTVTHGLSTHERALAGRLRTDAVRLLSGGPHRAPGSLVADATNAPGPEAWAALILGS